MFVRKLRLLTPGPTPLFPPAIRAMSAPDMHHRTKDFIEVYKSVVADLKYLYGSDNGDTVGRAYVRQNGTGIIHTVTGEKSYYRFDDRTGGAC